MQKKEFDTIINNLESLLAECEQVANKAENLDAVKSLKLYEIQELHTISVDLIKTQDQFFGAELYHIIGMANLTMPQLAKLLKLVRNLCSTRSSLKYFCYLVISEVPNPPTKSKYKCKVAGVTLKTEKWFKWDYIFEQSIV